MERIRMERFTYKHDDEWCINGVNDKISSDNRANYWGRSYQSSCRI